MRLAQGRVNFHVDFLVAGSFVKATELMKDAVSGMKRAIPLIVVCKWFSHSYCDSFFYYYLFIYLFIFTDFFTILYTYHKSHITSCKFYMLLIENHLHYNGM